MNKEEKTISLRWFGIPRLMPYIRPYRRVILWMILLGCLSSAIDAVYPLFTRYALDHFIAGETTRGIVLFGVVYLSLMVFQAVINYKSTADCGRIEVSMNRDLRNAAFGHLQTLSFSYYNSHAVGYIHARVMSDTGLIGDLVSWRMMNFVWFGSYLAGIVVIMLMIDVRLSLWLLALLPAAGLLMAYFQKKLLYFHRRIREINSRITGNFNEGIGGAASIKILGAQERIRSDFEEETGTMYRESVREAHFSAMMISTVTMVSSLVLALVLWKGGHLTREGVMRLGTLSVFMSYALEMLDPIQNILETYASFVAIQVNIERLTRLLAEKSEVADSLQVLEKYGDAFSPKKENWEELHGDVEFRDVSFHYPDGEELVLEHFSLMVPQGSNVAIVGETGAGKSTLVNLVGRFFEPTDGQVLIDGRDVRERSLLWLHSNIAYVLQTPHLFSGSVRENLRYGKPDASDEEIRNALRLVSADHILRRLPHGLDSEVGEGGSLLSTGEKQLLSFARAILADPRILILDEATASVDTETEREIQKATTAVTRGRTSFVIAHRLSTIAGADLILVIRDGKVAEQGTHKELMKRRGEYYQLYTRQYEELSWEEIS